MKQRLLVCFSLPSSPQAANVLLSSSETDRRGFVAKVSDFGLSRVLAGNKKEIKTQTFGTVRGAMTGAGAGSGPRGGA